jgi:hypothetical protein
MSFSLTIQGKDKAKQTLVYEGVELNSVDSSELDFLGQSNFILKEEEIGFSLEVLSDAYSFNKKPLAKGLHPIPNGHEFICAGHSITPVVLVDRAEVSKSAKTKSIISRVLIGLILAFELLVVFILPSSLSESTTFRRELLLEHATTELDQLRAQLNVKSSNDANMSAIRKAIIKQVRDELSDIARNVRGNQSHISTEELEEIKESLSICKELIPRLKYGSFIDQVPGLDRQLLLDRVFQED